jgi:hypothetical protein
MDRAEERPTYLLHNGIYRKTMYSSDYVPQNPSAEAKICLECTAKKCKGTCDRLKQERKKLKGAK